MAMKKNLWAAWLLVLPLAMAPVACSDEADDRAALRQDELGRELDLALRGDSTSQGVFEDTVIGMEPEPEPEPPPQAVRPRAPQRTPTPTPRPARQRTQPRRVDPAPEPAPAPAPQPRVVSSTVEMGTTLSLTLNETLSTRANQVGDAFTATLQSPVLDANGHVLIPSGATVRGRLTQVDKSGHVGETGILKLAFEAVSFGGRSYPMDASVVQAHPQRSNRTPVTESAAKVAAGAAAGAILGRVLGKNTGSTVKGAVIGAAAGTAIAMGTSDVDVVLPAGSEMVIRLDSPIEIRRTTS
jgi:hypothetical protein